MREIHAPRIYYNVRSHSLVGGTFALRFCKKRGPNAWLLDDLSVDL